jgi:hypothetical protein
MSRPNNLLALVSLLVAFSALGYNSWRNERTEYNRNVRVAAFEILTQLAELQLVMDFATYEGDIQRGNPITAWGRVGLVRDLSAVMPSPVPQAAGRLHQRWELDWSALRQDEAANRRITAEVRATRAAVLQALAALD